MKNPIKQSMGLTMIVATLLVTGLTVFLLIRHMEEKNQGGIHSDGETMTRLLSSISFEQLAPENGSSGSLQFLKSYLSNTDLAYIAITNSDGELLNRISKADVNIPEIVPDEEKSGWISEHELPLVGKDKSVIEYRAPLPGDGEIVGYVRTGYFKTSTDLFYQDVSLLAQVSFSIFMLMAFFYYLINRQMRPLQQANKKVCDLIMEQNDDISHDESGELKDFIRNFNQFMLLAKKQTSEMEILKIEAETSSRLLSYQKYRVESALHTLPDAIIIMDDAGNTTFANKKIETLLGVDRKIIVGQKPQEWCEDNQVVVLLSQYHGNLTPLHRVETIRYTPQKYPDRTISISVYPLFSPRDPEVVYGTLVSFRDVTEQMLAAQSRDEFVAHISHELKSPLNVIGMHGELLLDSENNDTDEYIHSVNVILDETERLGILINDLLKITDFEAGNISLKTQRVKLQDFLNDVFTSATRSAPQKNISTSISVAKSISIINVDKELMRIALNNVVSNAIKYSDENGSVSLEADEFDDVIQIQVTDTGIGISSDDQSHVFDKFYRSESEETQKRSGHGLGLALTKEIIQMHGGEITVDSKPGEGTTFTLRLMKTSTVLKEVI